MSQATSSRAVAEVGGGTEVVRSWPAESCTFSSHRPSSSRMTTRAPAPEVPSVRPASASGSAQGAAGSPGGNATGVALNAIIRVRALVLDRSTVVAELVSVGGAGVELTLLRDEESPYFVGTLGTPLAGDTVYELRLTWELYCEFMLGDFRCDEEPPVGGSIAITSIRTGTAPDEASSVIGSRTASPSS